MTRELDDALLKSLSAYRAAVADDAEATRRHRAIEKQLDAAREHAAETGVHRRDCFLELNKLIECEAKEVTK